VDSTSQKPYKQQLFFYTPHSQHLIKNNGFGHNAFQTPYKQQWLGAQRIPTTL
jgi:hypothetical protein